MQGRAPKQRDPPPSAALTPRAAPGSPATVAAEGPSLRDGCSFDSAALRG